MDWWNKEYFNLNEIIIVSQIFQPTILTKLSVAGITDKQYTCIYIEQYKKGQYLYLTANNLL